MQVLIQNCDTLEFFTPEHNWSEAVDKAADFKGTLAAAQEIRRYELKRAQILLKFGRPDLDIVLQLGECRDPARN